MDNQKIAKTLAQLADLLEFTGANPFRLRAYRNGARIIQDMTDPLANLVSERADLTKLEGVGKSVAEKIKELVETGGLKQLDELFEVVPKSVLDLLNVPKLGPKKCAALFNELGIESLAQLKAACEAQQVQALSGFGAKTEQQILEGIAIAAAANERILWAAADKMAERIRTYMAECEACLLYTSPSPRD